MARPYGFEADRKTPRAEEVAAIRSVVRLLLSEDEPVSLTRAAAWLNAEGHFTATGRPWEVGSLKRTVTSPLLAGLVAGPDGDLAGDAADPIIAPADREQLIQRLHRGPIERQQHYLLTGIVRCGHDGCGQRLSASRSYRAGPKNGARKAARAYVCPPPTALAERRRGCGRIRALADPLEDHVGAFVLARLAAPESAAAVARGILRQEQQVQRVRAEIEGARAKLSELAREWAYGGLPSADVRPIRDSLQRTIRDGEKQLHLAAALADTPVYDQEYLTLTQAAHSAGRGSQFLRAARMDPQTLADWWQAASVTRRRALVALLVKDVTVGPARTRGARTFDSERVKIVWR